MQPKTSSGGKSDFPQLQIGWSSQDKQSSAKQPSICSSKEVFTQENLSQSCRDPWHWQALCPDRNYLSFELSLSLKEGLLLQVMEGKVRHSCPSETPGSQPPAPALSLCSTEPNWTATALEAALEMEREERSTPHSVPPQTRKYRHVGSIPPAPAHSREG